MRAFKSSDLDYLYIGKYIIYKKVNEHRFVFKYENSIGGGHFWRCLNFSSQLSKKNIEFFFLTNILPKKNIDLLKNNRINYVEIKSEKFEENVLLKIKNLKIDSLILDCYDLKKLLK